MSNQTTPTPAPAPGSAEYNAAMIARAGEVTILDANGAKVPEAKAGDATNTQDANAAAIKPDTTKPDASKQAPVTPPAKPEGVPDKFWNAEKGEVNYAAWAKSTTEAEQKITQLSQGATLQDAVRAAQAELAAATDDAAKAAAQTKLDAANKAVTDAKTASEKAPSTNVQSVMESAGTEFEKDGKLSDATYEALDKAGMSRETVDAYIEGISAKAELYTTKLFGEAGGKDQYAAMTKWAEANYTKEQVEAFDAAVTSGDIAKAAAAVQSLKGLFTAANGQAPAKRIEGNNSATTTGAYFKSQAEVTSAMRDPRYKSDPAYRAEVAQKLEGSIRLNVDLGMYG